MKRITFHINNKLLVVVFLAIGLSCNTGQENDFSERTKIALRDTGNKLLLSNQDATSLILPVVAQENNKYQLAFDTPLSFEPSNLVSIIQESLKSLKLPEHYRVEVLQCSNREVAYSYQMSADEESTIIPCAGRFLPEACYLIEVKFTKTLSVFTIEDSIPYAFALVILIGISFLIFIKKKSNKTKKNNGNGVSEKLGSFYFYPEQNKLVKEAQEIALSKKECELLALFVANPNQIIKRDELTKRVWEDNGVFVGRSLDTYISKLRKKLKSDTSIKLTNIHGVGYKLEVE